MTIYIEEGFRRSVRTHVLANLLSEVPGFPLILGIFGPPGEGKTFQVERICDELGLRQHLVSPGELESENAGAPGQLLRTLYLRAGADATEGRPGVLVIHDFDTIMGNWGNLVQITVNRQVVYAQLMAFCDFPNIVTGTPTARVPIILTGNNPSILYAPLMRPGRMRLLRWRPAPATRARMIAPLFPQVDQRDLVRLIHRYERKPMAFWADVHAAIIEGRVVAAIDNLGEARLRTILATRSRIRVDDAVTSLDDIVTVAKELDSADLRSENFLGPNNT